MTSTNVASASKDSGLACGELELSNIQNIQKHKKHELTTACTQYEHTH